MSKNEFCNYFEKTIFPNLPTAWQAKLQEETEKEMAWPFSETTDICVVIEE